MGEINNEKIISYPKRSKELAEFVGIILGDGCVTSYKHPIKKNCYHGIRIAGNSITDRDYILNYVLPLTKKLFNVNPSIYEPKKERVMYLQLQSIRLIKFIKSIGLTPGNKLKNNQGIPDWIKQNPKYLKVCLRGLIDTDGCVYLCGNGTNFPRINFCSKIYKLKNDFYEALFYLKFNPTKWNGKNLMIYRKEDIFRYKKEIGFSNPKHLIRFKKYCKSALP